MTGSDRAILSVGHDPEHIEHLCCDCAIGQGGDLSLLADETALLGEVSVSSPAQALDASLTVTVDGRSYTCPLQSE